MKAFTSIFRREYGLYLILALWRDLRSEISDLRSGGRAQGLNRRRKRRSRPAPQPARKRPGRSFAISAGPLERRALLAVVGPVVGPSTVTAAATTAALRVVAPAPLGMGPAQYLTVGAAPSTSTQPGPDGSRGSFLHDHKGIFGPGRGGGPGQKPDWLNDHVSLAVKDVTVAGQSMPEFALANAGESRIFVGVGLGGSLVKLDSSQGIDHPFSVALADVNGDGIPDLVVANTGGNNVLVFPGLAGGKFGPEVNGGKGFAVGIRPVSVAVSDNHGITDLIVANQGAGIANQGSHNATGSVSILEGKASGDGWTATLAQTIGSLDRPVKAVLDDTNHNLFICDTGSSSVSMYMNRGDGAFDPTAAATFAVGQKPIEMFIGPFDKRLQTDLITINSGSDDITYVAGIYSPRPRVQTISSGGVFPDAAFAVDPNHAGMMDLVVANSGDGHMALLQAGGDGLQITNVITQAGVPIPTGVVPASWNSSGIDFLAANAGEDAAQLLHFDLGTASTYLPNPPGESTAVGQGDEELFTELMPFGGSSLELIAVFWAGSPDFSAVSGEWGLREPSSITSLYSPTEGQGGDQVKPTAEVASDQAPPAPRADDPSEVDTSLWARFVLGLDAALGRPRGFVDAVAARDALEKRDDRPVDELARLDRSPLDSTPAPDVEAASRAVDEALRLFWSEGKAGGEVPPTGPAPRLDPGPDLDGIDAPALEGQLESVPLASAALLVSTRLILKASPPRSPAPRKQPGRGGFSPLEDAHPGRNRPDPV